MVLVVGREEDGTPIVFSDVTSGTLYRLDYRGARETARGMSIERLEKALSDFDSARMRKPLVLRFLANLYDSISPAPDVFAYRDVLKQRKEQRNKQKV